MSENYTVFRSGFTILLLGTYNLVGSNSFAFKLKLLFVRKLFVGCV